MVGAYSDNQPDYSWLQPYEGRSFSMNWYPFRDIGGVKKANLDAAVNLDVANGTAKMGFYTTSAHAAAKVTLKAGQKVLLQETVAIDPGKPYTKQVAVPAGIDEHDLVASISDGGKELVSYSPVRLTPETRPQGVTDPPPPADVKTNEELYLIGLRAQQFHDPVNDPMPYWEEALRRDPGDTRVNTVLGITAYTKAKYAEAEKYLRTAIERLTAQFTTPKDAEAIYYLGATLKAEGKTDEAYTYFYQGDLEPGLEGGRLLFAGRDRRRARRYDRRSRFCRPLHRLQRAEHPGAEPEGRGVAAHRALQGGSASCWPRPRTRSTRSTCAPWPNAGWLRRTRRRRRRSPPP